MSRVLVEVILPEDHTFSADFSGRGTLGEVKLEIFALPEMASLKSQDFVMGIDQDTLLPDSSRIYDCHPTIAQLVKDSSPVRLRLFPAPSAPAALPPVSFKPAAPSPLAPTQKTREDIMNRLQELQKLVAEQDQTKKIMLENIEKQAEERRLQQLERQRSLAKMLEFQEQLKKEEASNSAKNERQKRLAEKAERVNLMKQRERDMKKNRLAYVRSEKKNIKVTHELPKIQRLYDMCLVDLDTKTITQFFTKEVIESYLSSLEETKGTDDYTIQIELTKLLLAIYEIFRKKFHQEHNLFREVILTGIYKITLIENAFFVLLGIFPSNKVTFWHSLLFIYDLLSSGVSAVLVDHPYVVELATFLQKKLSIIPPESPQTQQLYLEILQYMIANTSYSTDCPVLFDLYSTLQTVAISSAKPEESDNDSDSASYLSSEAEDIGNSALAKSILERRISPLLGKQGAK